MDESAKSVAEKAIVEALGAYLGRLDPTSALLLEGDWGSGKTYLINRFGRSIAEEKGKSFLLVSVAGLQSREQLDDALFFAANSFLDNGYAKAFGVFARAAARWVKIEPGDVKPKAEFESGTVVVVIDDFERFSGEIQILFGFVIELIDVLKVHVVILAAHDQLLARSEPNQIGIVDSWSEKIIGKRVRVGWEPRFVVEHCLNSMSDRFAVEALRKHVESIDAVIRASRVRNFRLVQQSIREVADVIAAMGDRFSAIEQCSAVLVVGLLVGQIELRRKWSNRKHVSRLLATPDLGFHLGAQASLAKGEDAGSESGDGFDSEEALNEFAQRVAHRYGDTEMILFPGSSTFSRYIEEDLVEPDAIVEAFQGLLSSPDSGVDKRSVLSSGLEEFTGAQFAAETQALFQRLDGGGITRLAEIGRIWVTGKHWVERRLLPFDLEELKRRCLRGIDILPANKVSDANADVESIFFWRIDADSDQVVKDALSRKAQEALDFARREQARDVMDLLKCGELANSDVKDPWLYESLFIGEVASWIKAIDEAPPRSLRVLIRLFGSRMQFVGPAVRFVGEIETLQAIHDHLRKKFSPEGMLTIEESQYEELAEAILRFLALVKKSL